MSLTKPTHLDPIELAIDALRTDLRTLTTGTIIKYNKAKQRADVQPAIQCRTTDGKVLTLPPIVDAPVYWPRGGGWRLHWSLKPGDTVAVAIADRALDSWLSQGGVVTPQDIRRHAITDGIVYPGIATDKNPQLNVGPLTDAVLGREDGSVEIRLSELGGMILAVATTLKLGGSGASLGVARTTDPTSLNGADIAALAALAAVHNAAVPGGPMLAGGSAIPVPTGIGSITAGSAKVLSQ